MIDVLVDAGRDILNFHIEKNPAKADSVIEMWISAECRLLKRLAVYGVAKNAHWSADKKLGWLLERNLLWAFGVKHEVFLLLEDCYAGASNELQTALLAQAGKCATS